MSPEDRKFLDACEIRSKRHARSHMPKADVVRLARLTGKPHAVQFFESHQDAPMEVHRDWLRLMIRVARKSA